MRILLVDHQPIFREGLKSILRSQDDFKIVGEADSCDSALQNARSADMLIVDGEVDSLNLLSALDKRRSKRRLPYVLVLTTHFQEQHAVQMLKAGADGYLCKSDSPKAVLDAIRKIANGGRCVADTLAETLVFAMNGLNDPGQLSRREYEVLYLFASGMGMSEIAAHLSLSVKTVSTYRSRLLEKLNLRGNAELMRYAFMKGVVA
jgi:two-component system invasion response regulator UvrY